MDLMLEIKSGICDYNPSDNKVVPKPDKGLIQIAKNRQDELTHLLWKKREPNSFPQLDLIIFPQEAEFMRVIPQREPSEVNEKEGDIFLLEITSTKERHFFWSQEAHKEKTQIFYEQMCRELGMPIGKQEEKKRSRENETSSTIPKENKPITSQPQPQFQPHSTQGGQKPPTNQSSTSISSSQFSATALEDILKNFTSRGPISDLSVTQLFHNVEQDSRLYNFFSDYTVQSKLIEHLPQNEREKLSKVLENIKQEEENKTGSGLVRHHLLDFLQSPQFLQSSDYLTSVLQENSNILCLLSQFGINSNPSNHQNLIGTESFLKALLEHSNQNNNNNK